MTDVATGWTVNRSVKNKAAIWVAEAIEHAARRFPLPDPGHRLGQRLRVHQRPPLEWCTSRQITFTRSRPGNKNDGCHVEQKNWTHVRELVGYLRFDTDAELGLLEPDLGARPRLHQPLLTQQKLISRTRVGAKVIKRHDRAQTPYQRLLAAGVLTPAQQGALTRARNALHPGQLQREIDRLCTRLERLALSKTGPPPAAVNRAFNRSLRRRVLREATNQRSRRI